MTKDEALKLALEALELVNIEFVCNGAHHAKKDRHEVGDECPVTDRYRQAIAAIKEALSQDEQEQDCKDGSCDCCWTEPALAQPEQKLVAWYYKEGLERGVSLKQETFKWIPLYTTPPKREWVGLTDKEAMQICVDCGCMSEDWLTLLDAITAKLKEKNS